MAKRKPSCSYDTNNAIAALRSYAELLSAAEFIQERCITNGGRYFGCPLDMLLQQATEAGWPGLEEA